MTRPPLSRRDFLQILSTAAAAWAAGGRLSAAGPDGDTIRNEHVVLQADPRVRLDFGPERMLMPGGLQPSLFSTAAGTLIVQCQLPAKPFPTRRMVYPSAVNTAVSRDGGSTWQRFAFPPQTNDANLEGGMVQLRDGTILVIDTYITPGGRPGTGSGQLYVSRDDWRTLAGPLDITFDLPGINFDASTDDSGRPHRAVRLHRRMLELPGGDLITTMYGWLGDDHHPAEYMRTMMKTRVMLLRSSNRGRHWRFVATVAAGPAGTEGFDEPSIARIGRGALAGRLICQMRTGQALWEAHSDDDGRTWSPAKPRVFADLDVYDTQRWAKQFVGVRDRHGRVITDDPTELVGAVVDPDLVELRDGTLVASFGVRVPPRACWPHCEFPWNGNYLAFSLDSGATWSHVVRLTTGQPTTHYTALAELPAPGGFFVAYDYGYWGNPGGRYCYGRPVRVEVTRTIL